MSDKMTHLRGTGSNPVICACPFPLQLERIAFMTSSKCILEVYDLIQMQFGTVLVAGSNPESYFCVACACALRSTGGLEFGVFTDEAYPRHLFALPVRFTSQSHDMYDY